MSDKKSLSDTFINYAANIRKYVGKFVNKDDIEDIVQETFVKSYEANLKQEIKYSRSYMFKTAKNLALNHNAKWDHKLKDSIEDFSESSVLSSSSSFENEFESKERFLLFCKATDRLSESVKKCFILKKVYGLTQKEIAQYLSLSESTIEKHIAKGLLETARYMELFEQNNTQSKNKITALSEGKVRKSL